MNGLNLELQIITIFRHILKDDVIRNFVESLKFVQAGDIENFLNSYTEFISLLYEKDENQNLYNYLKNLIYTDENIISKGAEVNNAIIETADYELMLFNKLLEFDYTVLQSKLKEKFNVDFIAHLPSYSVEGKQKFNLDELIKSYRHNGYGQFAGYTAFKFTEGKEIMPVKHFEAMTFSQLKNYEYQKRVIYNNTKAFIENKEANNILLYGDRGCGKSSTVKALINEFKSANLKIIQISKESFIYLADLYEQIRNLPLKFIIFADDLSFEESDKNFSAIKAVLEGSLSEKPKNTLIYATTNRMHLVKESFSAREGNEIHYNDTIDETVSLSDRFGIMLTFSLLDKAEYLDIVSKIAKDCGIQVNDNLLKKSEEFAMLKGIRTPRCAKQFIIDFLAETTV